MMKKYVVFACFMMVSSRVFCAPPPSISPEDQGQTAPFFKGFPAARNGKILKYLFGQPEHHKMPDGQNGARYLINTPEKIKTFFNMQLVCRDWNTAVKTYIQQPVFDLNIHNLPKLTRFGVGPSFQATKLVLSALINLKTLRLAGKVDANLCLRYLPKLTQLTIDPSFQANGASLTGPNALQTLHLAGKVDDFTASSLQNLMQLTIDPSFQANGASLVGPNALQNLHLTGKVDEFIASNLQNLMQLTIDPAFQAKKELYLSTNALKTLHLAGKIQDLSLYNLENLTQLTVDPSFSLSGELKVMGCPNLDEKAKETIASLGGRV